MVQPIRIKDFTRRQVRDRERLFNPESYDWGNVPTPKWDWMLGLLTGFIATLALGCLVIFGYVFYLTVTWP